MIKSANKTRTAESYDIRLEKEEKRYRLYFKTSENRSGILYRISAALYIENWNIIELSATTIDGEVQDCFLIEPLDNRISFLMENSLLSTIRRLMNNNITVMNYIAKFPVKWRNLMSSDKRDICKLEVSELSDEEYEIIIETEDRPGLIFEITQTLYRLYFDILKMESETFGKKATDKIYVVREAGKKSKYDSHILKEALDKIVD